MGMADAGAQDETKRSRRRGGRTRARRAVAGCAGCWRCRCCSWLLTRRCRCWCCASSIRRSGLHGRRGSSKPGRRATGLPHRLRLARSRRDLAATCRWRWSPRKTRTSPTHHGFDFKAIEKARDSNNARGPQGARRRSTISQQTAKNLFLWSGRSWVRKGMEAWYTVLIEALWPKRRILEVYANIAEFGDGIYGAQAAARSYFRKDARRLTPPKARAWRRCCPTRAATASRSPGPTCSAAQRDPAPGAPASAAPPTCRHWTDAPMAIAR